MGLLSEEATLQHTMTHDQWFPSSVFKLTKCYIFDCVLLLLMMVTSILFSLSIARYWIFILTVQYFNIYNKEKSTCMQLLGQSKSQIIPPSLKESTKFQFEIEVKFCLWMQLSKLQLWQQQVTTILTILSFFWSI